MSEEWVPLHQCAIAWDPIRTAPNRMAGYRYKQPYMISKEMNASKGMARLAWRQYGDRCFIVRVRLSLTVYRAGRRMDTDNVWGGMKYGRDMLFSALREGGQGFTPSDGPMWLETGTIEQIVGRDYESALRRGLVKGPTVVLTIEGSTGKRPKLSKAQRERVGAR